MLVNPNVLSHKMSLVGKGWVEILAQEEADDWKVLFSQLEAIMSKKKNKTLEHLTKAPFFSAFSMPSKMFMHFCKPPRD